ncbi:replication initiator protein A [Enterococcus raffinosus]|uniref:replication initiator protein A n=1 Tax=Enterococcus raffinosus TaxID=71452 RepID=UPI003AD17029
MTDFNFISANETYKALFYQLPKVLFESEKYIDMSNDSKIAYAMLKDRCEYSLQNNWVDQDGNIYFIFTTEELMDLLHCGNKKVAKIKKELTAFGLLLTKRMPPKIMPDGSKKGVPARLYLGQLDLTATDVFTSQNASSIEDDFESVDLTSSEKTHDTSKYSQSVDSTSSEKTLKQQSSPESVKRTHNLYKTIHKDTNRHNKDSRKIDQQDQLLLENFVALNTSKAVWVPEIVLNLIKTYSLDYKVAQETLHTIQKAKLRAEQETKTKIMYEDISNYIENPDFSLYTTVQKAFLKQKTEKVNNLQNVIFTYVKNWFVENPILIKKSLETRDSLPEIDVNSEFLRQKY